MQAGQVHTISHGDEGWVGEFGEDHVTQGGFGKKEGDREQSTHRLRMHRVDGEEQGSKEGACRVPEDSGVTGVHEHQAHQPVQQHIHGMEVEGVHARQVHVQPARRWAVWEGHSCSPNYSIAAIEQ